MSWPSMMAFVLAVGLVAGCGEAVTFTVAPDGDDTNPGTAEAPFASLERARDAIRELRAGDGLPAGGVTVELRGGVYERTAALDLTTEDSGTADAPIVYRARAGEEVRLFGGRTVSGWQPVGQDDAAARLPEAARDKVLVADLGAQGIIDYGKLTMRGFGKPMHAAHLELFYDGRPMTLARWPNGEYARMADLPENHGNRRFIYDGDAPARWAAEPDPWLYGYWFHDWADAYLPLEAVEVDNHVIALGADPPYGLRKGHRWFALNLLCELDEPGEWYLDRDTGRLYFWPPGDIAEGVPHVSLTPTLITMKDVSNVTIERLTLEATRGTAVTISGGEGNRVVACTLRNLGNRAVSIGGGNNNGVVGCDIYDTSDGGISLSGGDRKTLTPCGNYAENNHIHHYSRWCRTYRPAIGVHGVGIRVSHNLLHHGHHNAIQLGGNDHLIEFNEIHSVCTDTGDVGAFYMGRDWTARGTVIRNNYWHQIRGPGRIGAMGVYLDDQASGITIEGNVFHDVTRAAFIGGGCDNKVLNNLFIDCVPAVHIDARGLGWQKAATDDPKGTLRSRLAATAYQEPPYSERYPELVGILDDDPGTPKRNVVRRNVIVGGSFDSIHGGTRDLQIVEDNLVDVDPLFVDREALDFRLREDSPVYAAIGFEPVPFEQMGLVEDANRASWPVEHAPIDLDTIVVEVPTPTKPKGPAPVHRAPRAGSTVAVDGALSGDEWLGLATDLGVVIQQNFEGFDSKPISHAWVQWTGTALLVAFDNAVDPKHTISTTAVWGQDDAVEIAIRVAGDEATTFVLRGYPSGHFDGGVETARNSVTKRELPGTEYGARVVEKGRWTCEWRVPWEVLGVTAAVGQRLQLNLSVRKPAGGLWQMWESTRGNTHWVDRAGVLELSE